MESGTYYRSDEKLAITINSQGFSMDTDPWKVTIVNGCNKIVCDKDHNAVHDANNQWYLTFDTTPLGIGKPKAIIEIDVPDTDFVEKHYRHEIYVIPLKPIVKP